jgi:hypothetical protein
MLLFHGSLTGRRKKSGLLIASCHFLFYQVFPRFVYAVCRQSWQGGIAKVPCKVRVGLLFELGGANLFLQ